MEGQKVRTQIVTSLVKSSKDTIMIRTHSSKQTLVAALAKPAAL